MTRILVTGGRGLLGAAAAGHLAADGHELVATQRRPPCGESKIRWVQADLTRAEALDGLPGFDAIVHTAAVLPSSHTSSDREAEVNRQIDENVFSAAQRWEAAVVFTSSVATYGSGMAPAAGHGELDPLRPPGAYAAEKAWAEDHGHEQAARTGRPFTALRVSAPYGPRQRSVNVLRRFVERAARGEPLLYWGSGSRGQDFVHAEDVARACAAALRSAGGTFNIASGTTVTMRELAELVARAAGMPPSAVQAAGRPDVGEEERVAYCISRAREELGWEPRISLSEGVAAWLARIRDERG